MKILYLGDISPGQTSGMRLRALERLGYEARGVNTVAPWRQAGWLQRQVQRRLSRGSVVDEINEAVLAAAREFRPDIVWADKQEFLRAETLEAIKKLGARCLHFTPDPYFFLDWKQTRLMNEAMSCFDALVYCKVYEVANYESLGKPVFYMPLGYCDETHRPMPSSDPQWNCAVGFLGGWEPRRETLLSAVAASGVDLKVRGGYWDFLSDGKWTLRRHIILNQLAGKDHFKFRRNTVVADAYLGGEVYGDDYARALSGARIGLGFLRKVCPDQHTTRTFEIPACGSMLLSDRTQECQEFFAEGREAEYFDSPEELVDKVKFYTTHEEARAQIAAAGRQRCVDGRYSYLERMRDAMAWVKSW
ncbi:MAG: glycosyltransferase [Verrucomicrobia bacterium]|nr:glycosyltransferase [Verrucomicrobiota bacterium]